MLSSLLLVALTQAAPYRTIQCLTRSNGEGWVYSLNIGSDPYHLESTFEATNGDDVEKGGVNYVSVSKRSVVFSGQLGISPFEVMVPFTAVDRDGNPPESFRARVGVGRAGADAVFFLNCSVR